MPARRSARPTSLAECQGLVVACQLCPRLVRWRERVAVEKRRAFQDQEYWGRPVPGWGDPEARLLAVGLAPAAHGGNRTGRMFTGDRSGDWLYGAMHKAGFASQPAATGRDDGLRLHDAYITAVVHCAPPANKPTADERDNCLPYLVAEIGFLPRLRVIVALGRFAWDGLRLALAERGLDVGDFPKFGHGAEHRIGPYILIGSYHPSQQNTFTGRLTRPMLQRIFTRAGQLIAAKS